MSTSLKLAHVGRYKDIAVLLIKYGRSDVVAEAGLDDDIRHHAAPAPAKAEELATDLEAMGPTFIKLGQLLSTRSDLLPAPYIEALARLQDNVAPFPFEGVRGIRNNSLGGGITRPGAPRRTARRAGRGGEGSAAEHQEAGNRGSRGPGGDR